MDGDPNDGDALLEAVIAGDVDQHDPRVRALLAAQPALRDRLAAMQKVAAELDAAAADDRRTMQQVMAGSEPPGTGTPHTVTQQGWRKRPFLLLAAAATLLGGAMLGILWWPAPPASNDSTVGQRAQERWPVGEVSEADYGEFRWSLPLPEAGHYVLHIYDGDGDTELLHLPPLYESHWRPNAEERGKLRPRMTWEVEAQRPGGRVSKSLERVAVSLRR